MWMWRPGEGGSLQSIVSAEVHVQFKNFITFLAKRHKVISLDIWVALKKPFVSKAYLTSAMGSVATENSFYSTLVFSHSAISTMSLCRV